MSLYLYMVIKSWLWLSPKVNKLLLIQVSFLQEGFEIMMSTIKKYDAFFHPVIQAATKANTPMYNLVICLFILSIGVMMKVFHFGGATSFIYGGLVTTFIMSIKSSFFYYRKAKKLEIQLRLERLN